MMYSSVRKEWNLFFGELIVELCIYFRNTQKQQKITIYGWIKSF